KLNYEWHRFNGHCCNYFHCCLLYLRKISGKEIASRPEPENSCNRNGRWGRLRGGEKTRTFRTPFCYHCWGWTNCRTDYGSCFWLDSGCSMDYYRQYYLWQSSRLRIIASIHSSSGAVYRDNY